jgi:hypothetical protein
MLVEFTGAFCCLGVPGMRMENPPPGGVKVRQTEFFAWDRRWGLDGFGEAAIALEWLSPIRFPAVSVETSVEAAIVVTSENREAGNPEREKSEIRLCIKLIACSKQERDTEQEGQDDDLRRFTEPQIIDRRLNSSLNQG